MGRPRKSEQQHHQEGTYRPRSHDGLGGPAESGAMAKPGDLTDWESDFWDEVSRPWMTALDRRQFRRLVELAYLSRLALDRFKETNSATDRNSALQFGAQLDRLAAAFGMTPSDRAKLPKMGPEKKDDDERFFRTVG